MNLQEAYWVTQIDGEVEDGQVGLGATKENEEEVVDTLRRIMEKGLCPGLVVPPDEVDALIAFSALRSRLNELDNVAV